MPQFLAFVGDVLPPIDGTLLVVVWTIGVLLSFTRCLVPGSIVSLPPSRRLRNWRSGLMVFGMPSLSRSPRLRRMPLSLWQRPLSMRPVFYLSLVAALRGVASVLGPCVRIQCGQRLEPCCGHSAWCSLLHCICLGIVIWNGFLELCLSNRRALVLIPFWGLPSILLGSDVWLVRRRLLAKASGSLCLRGCVMT